MRVLALETSGHHGSIAILNGLPDGSVQMVGQAELSSRERTAESLVPAIGGLLDQIGWHPHTVQVVSVATGPGSFTGLRMGITIAKTFAYAADADLVGIHTLAALVKPVHAKSSPHEVSERRGLPGHLWAILNAQRQELFVARFEQASNSQHDPTTYVMGIPDWLDQLRPGDTVVGPPLEKLATELPKGTDAVAKKWWQPGAVAVGQLGIALALKSKQVHSMQLVPQYFRKSAAEEKANGE